jgi:polygalacturonase
LKSGKIVVAALAAVLSLTARAEAPFPLSKVPDVSIPDRRVDVTDYGARADGMKCTKAFADAIAACAAAGGGRVVVPAGRYFTGPIHLKSNVGLHLEKGAFIEFSDDPKDCLPAVPSSWEGLECLNYSPLLYACGCTNVAVTGAGTIRAKMDYWKELMQEKTTDIMGARAILYKWGSEDYPVGKRDMTKAHPAIMRPQLIQFNRCKGVRIADVRVEDSPFWTIHLFMCEDVTVSGIDVCAHGFNNDGIDIEMTQNVLVEDSSFDQGDDGFVFKAGRNRDGWRVSRPTRNVEIRNCRVKKAGSLVGVGSELSGGIENIYVHDCRVGLVARLYYVKTNRRRGGFVRNICVENVTVEKTLKLMALETDVLYQWKVFPDYELRTTEIERLEMRHVFCGGVKIGIDLFGDGKKPARNVVLEDVRVGTFEYGPVRVDNVEGLEMSGVSFGRKEKIVTVPEWDNGFACSEEERACKLKVK